MNPVLSICILTFNRSSFLETLLNSIISIDKKCLEQIEIIIIDNGSTDNTWTTLQKVFKLQKFYI